VQLADWDRVMLVPTGLPESSPAAFGLNYEDIRFPSANGNMLTGWLVPATSGKPLATILVHTGMRGNVETYLSTVPWAANNDFNIMIYDWQGFGASEGVAHFTNWEPDMRAAVDYLLSRPESSTGIIQMGASLGAIPGLAATAWYPDQTIGLVLYGGFFTGDFAESWLIYQVTPLLASFGMMGDFAWNALLPDFFDGRRYLDSIHVPILSITPADDTIVPVPEQDKFYEALPEPKQRYFTYGGHVHACDTDPELGNAVIAWAKALPAIQQRQP
jgi:hypothetical protein